MSTLRKLIRRIDESMLSERFVIGSQGLQKPKSGVTLQANCEYYLGASSSPSHIIVTKVGDEYIEYVQGPTYKEKRRMERWIAEDLIIKGTETWLDQWGKQPYPWVKEAVKNFRAVLSGGKGKTVKPEDFYQVRATVAAADGSDVFKLWRDAERYGGVGGKNDKSALIIDMRQGDIDDLKKDKKFKVLDVQDL